MGRRIYYKSDIPGTPNVHEIPAWKREDYPRTYAALLAKIGITRMNEIEREAAATVAELVGAR